MDPGATLGPYRIDRELGSGGLGPVYAATGPDGVVALNLVHPHLLEQPGFFKRFLREADIRVVPHTCEPASERRATAPQGVLSGVRQHALRLLARVLQQ